MSDSRALTTAALSTRNQSSTFNRLSESLRQMSYDLQRAITRGDINAVRRCLDAGADIEETRVPFNGATPLMVAVSSGMGRNPRNRRHGAGTHRRGSLHRVPEPRALVWGTRRALLRAG